MEADDELRGTEIPADQISPEALRGLIEEFVTRDGTDLSPVEPRIEKVLRRLDAGNVELHFDEATKTCNVVVSVTEHE